MSYIRDTIAAISTPIGFGGIGVVRVSGGEAFQIVSTISSIEEPESHRAYHTWLIDDLDEVIITFFKSPKSYTGEDVVEISCHGSPFILQKVLELLIKGGAREGLKGEFTKRAFLNEKLDLLQAEGVLSLINSQTDIGADISAYNLRGGLSSKITELKNRGINLLTKLQAATDFPDDLDHFPNIKEEGAELLSSVSDVIKTARYGKLAVCGVKTVIVGKPNVGKSSLLNLLLKEDRAIVTEIPGTTRDVVSENINIKGALFSLYDTAGIRESNDLVEMAGIDLAEKHIDIADLILVVLDSSKPLDDMDNLVLEKTKSKERIIVLNKADLFSKEFDKIDGVKVSARSGVGVDDLEEKLFSFISKSNKMGGDVVIVSERQKGLLEKGKAFLATAVDGMAREADLDLVSIDLQSFIEALGEMTGKDVGGEVLDNIFSNFCVGK